MANPTTNYGFVLPTSTDLVTDLPADFDVALQGVDTRLKALQPGTTLGDIAYSSATANTNTRLGIGSTGQVLTVASGVPSWATASSSAVTLIARTTFSAVTSQAFDSIFTSTYKSYMVVIENIGGATASDDLQLQFRYGSTTKTTGYYGGSWTTYNNSTTQAIGNSNDSFCSITPGIGTSAEVVSATLWFNRVGNGNQSPQFRGNAFNANSAGQSVFGGYNTDTGQTYTGFLLKAEGGGNIAGTVAIYGLVTA